MTTKMVCGRMGRGGPWKRISTWMASTLALASGLMLAAPPQAHACLPPYCGGPSDWRVKPADGELLPGNARAFAIGGNIAGKVTVGQLRAGGGPLIAATVEPDGFEDVLVRVDPLTPNTEYTFDVGVACFGGTPQSDTRTFRTGPNAPMPTSIGTLSVHDVALATKSGRAPLHFEASPDLKPWLPITRFTTLVDGARTTGSFGPTYGSSPSSALSLDCSGAYSACYESLVGPGTHTVVVSAHIAGADSDPPALTASFTMTCTSEDGDAGIPDSGAAVDASISDGGEIVDAGIPDSGESVLDADAGIPDGGAIADGAGPGTTLAPDAEPVVAERGGEQQSAPPIEDVLAERGGASCATSSKPPASELGIFVVAAALASRIVRRRRRAGSGGQPLTR
jgi:hypothetical protein